MRLQTRQLWRLLDGLPPVKVHAHFSQRGNPCGTHGITQRKNGIKIEGLEKPVNDISEKEEAPEEDY